MPHLASAIADEGEAPAAQEGPDWKQEIWRQ
jgi:hypothetical protein